MGGKIETSGGKKLYLVQRRGVIFVRIFFFVEKLSNYVLH